MGYKITCCIALLFSVFCQASPLVQTQVPEPLKPWVDWVLQDNVDFGCPFVYNSYEQKRCNWPIQLDMDFTSKEGRFTMDWNVQKESWIRLPGNIVNWPQNVTANAKQIAVLERNGEPVVKLSAGIYHMKGGFIWSAIPESLNIPSDAGLIHLSVNGVKIPLPSVREGQLWLTESELGQKKLENIQNSLDVQVYRKITDDVPLLLTTRLVLEVSGEQREVKLNKPILDDFKAIRLQSPLPARIEPDGQLLVQLKPGRWELEIEAKSVKETNNLWLPSDATSWPKAEIWVFEARPDLRIVEVEKLTAIDASQTNSPEEWRNLPTYKINQGETMELKVIRRGDPNSSPNQLSLKRTFWLDFDGVGYTVKDNINGNMTNGWRLDALEGMRLGQVSLEGKNQLITLHPVTNQSGVEVRQGQIALEADSRIEGGINQLNAVGWKQNFQQVDAELNLPPGWRLFAATGVDNVPESWIARWTLLDLFLVLIAALATSRLYNRYWGALALVTLALMWHEAGAPHYLWLNCLMAIALLKVLPPGRFLSAMIWYRNLSWLALALFLIPFMIMQARIGIYPQLEEPDYIYSTGLQPASDATSVESAQMATPAPEAMPTIEARKGILSDKSAILRKFNTPASAPVEEQDFSRYDPDAKVQTGPGLPQWQWHKVFLNWNGSVDSEQHIHLWYLAPNTIMFLNFIRIILVSLFAVLLLGLDVVNAIRNKALSAVVLGLVLIPVTLLPSQKVYADYPGKEVLEELKNRLLQAPDCMPNCAQIPTVDVVINENDVQLVVQVGAEQTVMLPLPAAYNQWFPHQVLLDGRPSQGLYRNDNDLWITVPAGSHQIVMRGLAPPLNSFTIPLPMKPGHVSVQNTGWDINGLQDNGQAEGQIQFIRSSNASNKGPEAKLAQGILPAFVKVERTLQLGLDWRVLTQVTRLSPPDSAVILDIPLLPGERVMTPGLNVHNGKLTINLSAQQSDVQWESSLEKGENIQLAAASTDQWIEVWKADVSPIWHMEPQGLAAMHMNFEGQWLPEWHPWPGEKLNMIISRPKALVSQTLTIDGSELTIKPGARALDADLNLTIRSSQGTQHTIILPDKAVVQTVMADGKLLPLRQDGNKLTLPIAPGKQSFALSWQQPTPISNLARSPEVDLGQASVNSRINIKLGQDRWVLLVAGPPLGPAVLFWGMIIVMVIVSYGLGKLTLTPLKNWQWLLLLIGLSQVPIGFASIVVGWLLLLGWRRNISILENKYFNGIQSLIVLTTLFSLGILVLAVEQGLLGGTPDMLITGNQSTALDLHWFQDKSQAKLPRASVISIPLFSYRLLMLAWSFWLAASLLSWLKWGWQCFSHTGLWHKQPKKEKSSSLPPETKNRVQDEWKL